MNSKIFILFAAVLAVLLVGQAVESAAVKPDELYVLNPGGDHQVVVDDPNSPLLQLTRQVIRICIASQCQATCRSWGFRYGRCNIQAICVCSNW